MASKAVSDPTNSNNMSNSSDEDDDLLSFTPFANKKRKHIEMTTPPAAFKQLNAESDNDIELEIIEITTPPAASKQSSNAIDANAESDTDTELEVAAQRKVNIAFVPLQITSPSMIYWHKETKKKKRIGRGKSAIIYHPCRECHPDEGIGLDLPQNFDNKVKVLVQYIEGTSFGARSVILRKLLVPYNGQEVDSEASADATSKNGQVKSIWCPDKVEEMSNRKKKIKKKGVTDFEIKVDIRAAELYMEKVLTVSMERTEEIKKLQELKDRADAESELAWQLQHDEEQKQEGEEVQSPFATQATVISQSQGDNGYSSSDDSLILSQEVRKTQPIRPGDIIEYYQPNQIFGDERYLNQSTVEQVDSKAFMKLKLEGGVFLDGDQKVKLLQIIKRGKLEKFVGQWMHVKDFKLRTATLKSAEGATGMIGHVKRMKEVLDENKRLAVEKVKEAGLGQFADFMK